MCTSTQTIIKKDKSLLSRLISILVICLVFFGLGATQVNAATPKKKTSLSDNAITKTIEDEMLFTKGVTPGDIDVVTLKGVVTLTGKASTLLEKERAAVIAKTVKGVRSVINQIAVKPQWGLTDSQILENAKMALIYDHATEAFEIVIDVEGHVATLSGEVDSWRERELAETVIKGVRGIKAVNNKIKFKKRADFRNDLELQAEVRETLEWDVLVDDALIQVDVKNARVTLTGTAGSAAEKRQAYSDAWVTGVTAVDDSELEVKPWARDEKLRKQRLVRKADKDIEKAVRDAITYDPRVRSSQVRVAVAKGTITLTGTVDNLFAKRAAERDAWNTVGVSSVVNRVRVDVPSPTDSELARRIRRIFSWDVYVGPFGVNVRVTDGIAHLTGKVDSNFEKARADDLAAATFGIKGVQNNIKVEEPIHRLVFNPYLSPYSPQAYDWYDKAEKPNRATRRRLGRPLRLGMTMSLSWKR
jgi:osmotically-inducible protein OsmY